MAQGHQDSLIKWLDSNNLDFMKDALVSEHYTLDMICDMTNDEMIGTFDELNVSNIKRPRFRNAVNRLKKEKQSQPPTQTQSVSKTENKNNNEKENKNSNSDTKENEETFESLLSVEDSQRIKNPYVIISAIEDYSQSEPKGKWYNLNGPNVDVKNMIHLWKDIYNYKHVSIAFKKEIKNDDDEKKNKNPMNNNQTFGDFLVGIRAKIDANKCNDGLIFYYSGHGVRNGIILADGKRYKFSDIIEIFNGKHCVYLRNKPKIMIYDCCRGFDISATYDHDAQPINVAIKGPNNPKNEWINNKYHINSGLATIFSNFEKFSTSDSDTHGGCLTRSILKMFENPFKASNYSLRELIIGIRRQTKINSGIGNKEFKSSNQLVDFHETLENKIYFDKCGSYNDNNINGGFNDNKEEDEVKDPEYKGNLAQSESISIGIADKINKIDWKFNYQFDFWNRGSKMHAIEKNGKSVKCNWHDDYDHCLCFTTVSNNGMQPYSGIYTIKIKINNIGNRCRFSYNNIIGITSERYDNSHEKLRNNKYYDWNEDSNNYIGWSACNNQDDIRLPNGLYCGFGNDSIKKNIFRKNNFIYQSDNGRYKKRLPGFKSGDILILSYNSVLNQLSFQKENGKLNSFIKNLPKNLTFYWFVGHFDNKPMSISIVD